MNVIALFAIYYFKYNFNLIFILVLIIPTRTIFIQIIQLYHTFIILIARFSNPHCPHMFFLNNCHHEVCHIYSLVFKSLITQKLLFRISIYTIMLYININNLFNNLLSNQSLEEEIYIGTEVH